MFRKEKIIINEKYYDEKCRVKLAIEYSYIVLVFC